MNPNRRATLAGVSAGMGIALTVGGVLFALPAAIGVGVCLVLATALLWPITR